ncbi:hypothetical protein LX15_004775 [Streptoalloteichus tenebrarius]|uniref:Uncharacterized protein n=1 Tax=Streptoalloteichus tenebrarius (strain ATCC 17920 / DSM 40477 / JCM 4838 / CBS 697.72 / NBRC 16177 / NCIMB 11028 / NRRL B-12390 / A12253. 1 / ISP 5477) TaxID=1933 RepID=A0ABT1HZW0_STRSD|nr:hypothetical protein [Streptoalloteichus tenebrarius]MCP2261055.1 hypothetical protein [Streptoalloteichus tenebrarius]
MALCMPLCEAAGQLAEQGRVGQGGGVRWPGLRRSLVLGEDSGLDQKLL